MKECKKCRRTFDDELAYCPYCGEKLEERIECPKCKKAIPTGSSFCPFCGENLTKKVEPEPEEVAQEVVDSDGKTIKKQYTEEQLEKYRRQLENYRRKRSNFTLAGGLVLGVGILSLILGLVLVVVNAMLDGYVALIVVGTIMMGLGFALEIPSGAALIAVGVALFSKRIENRERILEK